MDKFSSLHRSEYLADMAKEELDLLIIGGGITGAGILLDAQVRGLKAAIVEMQDFAAGTSSRSTKLVHGGLRYLKQLEIKLVAEVGKERAIVYENAPHVTTPEWMLLPLIEGGTYGRFTTSVGLKVYDYLAGVKRDERRTMLSRAQTMEKEPLLREDKLKGGGYYVEYRTDDARLTIEVMKEAVARGAKAINYVKAENFIYDRNHHILGSLAVDLLTGDKKMIRAKKIVNAAGPWADTLREIDGSKKGKHLRLTKGVHLVFDQSKFPLRQSIYFDTPDGRMVFAIPRDGKTYLGTTDTFYEGDITGPTVTLDDQNYLVTAANFMFPSLGLTIKDIESSWSGLRPLIHEEGKSPSELSRKDEIFISDSGLITIAGGKLTGYRKMAERVVDLVAKDLSAAGGPSYPKCTTDRIVLSGGHFGGSAEYKLFVQKKVEEGTRLGLTTQIAEKLTRRYGSNIDLLYDIYKSEQWTHNNPELWLPLVYGIRHEMVATPSDFFIRRTGALYFHIAWVHKWKETVNQYMQSEFQWSEEQETKYRDTLDRQLHEAAHAVSLQ
ncbi:glycerol-3-phosphate dehydrogenase [Paenibacillus sediminis]|uniref:Aerobic glycerol-3-phosphate dehydrogenase n=2 Tax=Paenibacillus sediminis TaxID=664909 RepID=A0ABS4H2T1_9BACL|nr:glycerol-3-phosphate dehydrogenase [Paenibacillus sediminis]